MPKYFNILLADDDQDDQDFFSEALATLQIAGSPAKDVVRVINVYNGVQAMDYLLKRGAYKDSKDGAPDFIVLDLNMPIMDGFSVLHEIRSHGQVKDTPVYILSTSRDENHKKKCRELGCAGFFSKPPKLNELQKVIEIMFNASK